MIARRIILLIFILAGICYAEDGNYFRFTQLKYENKWDPYPETWQDILEFLTTTTSIKPLKERKIITLDDEALFSCPYLFLLGTETFPTLTEKNRTVIRRYLANGGMIFVEDSSKIFRGLWNIWDRDL